MSIPSSRTAARPYVTVTLMLGTAGVYAWVLADYGAVFDVLSADYAMLYQEPWRVITSPFIHIYAPHALFNLVTLWIFGRGVEGRFGRRVFIGIFFGALLTGHVVQMLAHGNYVVGISGGVCGLYGFLLRMDKKPTLRATLLQRPSYWGYAVSLLLLAVVDQLGLLSIANWNHAVGIAFGYVVGLGRTAKGGRVAWRLLAFALPVLACIPLVYRPWELTWQALHGVYDASQVLPLFSCEEARRPVGDVTKNGFVSVTVLDRSERAKRFYYVDPDGRKVLSDESSRRLYRMRPYLGTVWTVEDEARRCYAQFEVKKGGIIELD